MKISSASKKVLASALSAAMVVAFAPTAAFAAAANDRITLSYDMAGGTVTGNVQEIESGVAKVGNDTKVTVADASNYAKGGYDFKDFIIDLNGNGVQDNGETTVTSGAAFDASAIAANDTVKLVAEYSVPTVSKGTLASQKAVEAGALSIKFGDTSNIKTDHDYKVTLSKDGAEVVSTAYKASELSTANWEQVNFGQDQAYALKSNKVGVKDKLAAGTYIFTLTDETSKVSLSSVEYQVISVAADGAGSLFKTTVASADQYSSSANIMAVVGQTWTDVIANSGIDLTTYKANSDGTYTAAQNSNGYRLAGFKAGDTIVANYASNTVSGTSEAVKAGQTVIKAFYSVPGFTSELALTNTSNASGFGLTVTPGNFDLSKFEDYKVTIVAPDGTKLVDAAAATDNVAATVSFGSVKPATGEYTATLTAKKKSDGTTSTVATSKVSLVKVAFDLGGSESNKPAIDGNIYAVGDKSIAKTTIAAWDAPTLEGKVFDKWTVNGADVAYDASGNFVMPTGTDGAVTFTATYKEESAVKAAKATYAYADGKVTFAQAQGDDYEIVYGTAASPSTVYSTTGSGVSVATTGASAYAQTLYAAVRGKANASASTLQQSDNLVVSGYKASGANQVTALNDAIGTLAAASPSDSTSSSPKYWDKVLKGETDAAEAAIKAIGYASIDDWAAAVNAQVKTVVDAAASYETKAAGTKAVLTASKDGKTYTYATDEELKKATDAIDAAVAAYVENTNDDAVYAKYDATKKAWVTEGVKKSDVSSLKATDYIAKMTAAAKGIALTTVQAADVEAAKAFDDKVAKLAADYATVTRDNYVEAAAAAADAQTDYAALTAAQKALVTADTQVIAKVIADAAEIADQVKDEETAKQLADAQDLAAARQLYSKTVTAKAKVGKKAQGKSFAYKLGASESGAVATYSKASGSKYIKVSKSGKVTFSKVKAAKKAKTYKAKVTVTYGTQTATKTVTYKVAKK